MDVPQNQSGNRPNDAEENYVDGISKNYISLVIENEKLKEDIKKEKYRLELKEKEQKEEYISDSETEIDYGYSRKREYIENKYNGLIYAH